MEPTRELIDALYRERVLRARGMSPEEKFLSGPRLFEMACRISMDGIRSQHPDADEARVRQILEQRLALGERLERWGYVHAWCDRHGTRDLLDEVRRSIPPL